MITQLECNIAQTKEVATASFLKMKNLTDQQPYLNLRFSMVLSSFLFSMEAWTLKKVESFECE